MKITKIEELPRDKKRLSIYVEDEYCTRLTVEIVRRNELYEGLIMDRKDFEKLIFDSEENKAFDVLLTYITKSMKTEKECRKNLFGKGYYSKIVYSAIDKAKGYGYVDDGKYVETYVSYYSETRGKRRLSAELHQKGIDDNLIKEALANVDVEVELDGSISAAQKYMKNKENNRKNIDKLIRHLMSKGYEWSVIKKAIKTIGTDAENIPDEE